MPQIRFNLLRRSDVSRFIGKARTNSFVFYLVEWKSQMQKQISWEPTSIMGNMGKFLKKFNDSIKGEVLPYVHSQFYEDGMQLLKTANWESQRQKNSWKIEKIVGKRSINGHLHYFMKWKNHSFFVSDWIAQHGLWRLYSQELKQFKAQIQGHSFPYIDHNSVGQFIQNERIKFTKDKCLNDEVLLIVKQSKKQIISAKRAKKEKQNIFKQQTNQIERQQIVEQLVYNLKQRLWTPIQSLYIKDEFPTKNQQVKLEQKTSKKADNLKEQGNKKMQEINNNKSGRYNIKTRNQQKLNNRQPQSILRQISKKDRPISLPQPIYRKKGSTMKLQFVERLKHKRKIKIQKKYLPLSNECRKYENSCKHNQDSINKLQKQPLLGQKYYNVRLGTQQNISQAIVNGIGQVFVEAFDTIGIINNCKRDKVENQLLQTRVFQLKTNQMQYAPMSRSSNLKNQPDQQAQPQISDLISEDYLFPQDQNRTESFQNDNKTCKLQYQKLNTQINKHLLQLPMQQKQVNNNILNQDSIKNNHTLLLQFQVINKDQLNEIVPEKQYGSSQSNKKQRCQNIKMNQFQQMKANQHSSKQIYSISLFSSNIISIINNQRKRHRKDKLQQNLYRVIFSNDTTQKIQQSPNQKQFLQLPQQLEQRFLQTSYLKKYHNDEFVQYLERQMNELKVNNQKQKAISQNKKEFLGQSVHRVK